MKERCSFSGEANGAGEGPGDSGRDADIAGGGEASSSAFALSSPARHPPPLKESSPPITMHNNSKISDASVSTPPALPALQGWADLPDGLLHSIIALSDSFIDLLAFAGTCCSWRAAFSSYPSKSTLCTLLPPLLVRPNDHAQASHPPCSNGRQKLHTCRVIDPANRSKALRCQIPQETLHKMYFAGSSFGHIICCHRGYCLVVDVFTGAQVSPPRLPFRDDCEEIYFCGMLTAPLASPNSHLIVCNEHFLYDWQVGTDCWSELKLPDLRVDQIVNFNGQLILLAHKRLFTLQLAPQLGLQEIETEWGNGTADFLYIMPWLVVCGDMLLIVGHDIIHSFGEPDKYAPYCLDMSTEPVKLVRVDRLDNWTLFLGVDVRSQPFSCMSPGQWRGRSNRLYHALDSHPWTVFGLGDEADALWDLPPTEDELEDLSYKRAWYTELQALWLYPSMFYSDGQ